MALHIYTADPNGLLQDFYSAILQTEAKGKIETWRMNDKSSVTHTSVQWGGMAWMSPSIDPGRLRFNIIKTVSRNVTVTVYGFYHGHLAETFLNHFDLKFSYIQTTAIADLDDFVMSS